MTDNNMSERPRPKLKLKKVRNAVAVLGISAGLVASCAPSQAQNPDSPIPPQTTTITTPEINSSWQSEQLLPGENFMAGTEANQIAKHLGITPESFFQFPPGEDFWKQPEMLSALSDESIINDIENYDLPPVFPPSVLKWQPEIKAAVVTVYQKTGIFIPPEIVAFTMTAESAGLSGVDSPEPHINDVGIGLMQVLRSNMEHYILDKNVLGDNMQASNESVFNPRINTLIGTFKLADDIKDASREDQTSAIKHIGYGPFLAKVIASYNAGGNGISMEHTELMKHTGYQGTVIYRDDAQRFLMVLAIEKQLRLSGCTRNQIVDQLKSTQVDSMAYAFNILLSEDQSKGDYSTYNLRLSQTASGQDPRIQSLIQEYQDQPRWSMPVNPALRIFCKRGGDWLFLQSPENHQNTSFYYMQPDEIRRYLNSQSQLPPRETTAQRNKRRGYSTQKHSSRPHAV